MEFSLKNKVLLITGASRGIGQAAAIGLAQAGADLAITSRKLSDLEKVAEEIKKTGSKCLPVPAHVGKMEEIDNLVKRVLEEFGRIDILVNNAARSFLRSLMDLREDGWDKVFNTNVKAVWLLSRLVARKMMEQKGGRIINITTVGAEKAELGMAAYGCSKAALKMLTRCMAREWAQFGIQVNAVGPGLTKTDFSKPIWSNPEVAKHVSAAIPMGRLAEAEEIVGSVLFLASDAARFITGHSIYVDGGALTT
jgi:2-deoxy-D-gluconate 3-dehydrogenase